LNIFPTPIVVAVHFPTRAVNGRETHPAASGMGIASWLDAQPSDRLASVPASKIKERRKSPEEDIEKIFHLPPGFCPCRFRS
jgi:hypothetical protein